MLRRFTTVAFLLLVGALSVFAQFGAFKAEGKIDNGKAELKWDKPSMMSVDYYLVFRGVLGDSSLAHVKIDSTTNLYSITDAPVVSNPNVSVTFIYYVRAKITGGGFLTSTLINLTVFNNPNQDELEFVSVPPKYGQKNVPFVYTAKAVSNDSTAVITYAVDAGHVPSGFSINASSGVVAWTPVEKGWYEIRIFALSSKGDHERQEFFVIVAGGNGTVQGKVTDTNSVAISKVLIELFKSENNTSMSFTYSTLTDDNGNYRIDHVDPGSYKLRANASSLKYENQWYNGKYEASQADLISVADSVATVANFTLRVRHRDDSKDTVLTVSGSVTDTLGSAINGIDTRVFFVRAEFALNVNGGLNFASENFRKYFELTAKGDFSLEGSSEHVTKVHPDSLGKYSLKLRPGIYIAFAKAKGYATEFFKEQSNLLSANLIRLQKDSSGINFTLAPLPPVVLGQMKGAVLDSIKNIGVSSRVIAFRDGWRMHDDFDVSRVYVTDTDSTGAYVFNDVLPGTYVVLALPLGNYAPAFYSTDTSRVFWKHATKIVINGNSVDNINIYVKQLSLFANGYTGINGNVGVTMGMGTMNTDVKAGAIVYAVHNSEVAGYAITDASGNYRIDGLAPGSYSAFVDKPGFHESTVQSVNTSYTLTGSPSNATANFTINSVLSVSTNSSVQPKSYALAQNFPNPFNPSTTISYTLPASGNISLKVYNIVGQEVMTLVNGYQNSGEYRATFDAKGLASGIYFYRLQAGSFNQVKKMMLIK
ncbi:MAG: carboxypeptidase regulatory-like domain-containing protein [Bacteroidota bacterium]|nr:carboxypeptidase regulatory-like domain-containing protein [Bacteroidota bacterium]